MKSRITFLALAVIGLTLLPGFSAEKLKALLVDGQNNHKWQETTPVLVSILENSGRFTVEVATSPPKGQDNSGFKPDFAKYDVVLSNYNGDLWAEATRNAFADYVNGGGGFVCIHAADNSFPQWKEYNTMIGVGGWGGRNEKSGPMLRIRDGRLVRVRTPGRGGAHGKRHEFVVERVGSPHPITAGLPARWKHTDDELYATLRGPAENVTVLASAYADPATGGTGENEPILMLVEYGKGKVFHTTLGHHVPSLEGLGFQESLLRGAEFVATGKVTFPKVADADLPADKAVKKPVKPVAVSGAAKPAPGKPAKPDAPTPPKAEKDADGFVSLFDGMSLEGWEQLNGTAEYRVENGVIVGKTKEGSPNSFLCTKPEFANFELHFQVKVDDGLNSGVQIRSRQKTKEEGAKDEGRFHGPQVEIEMSPGQSGYIYGEATGLGWLSPEPQEKSHAHEHIKNGEWNQYRVLAEGPRIQTWINGQKVADLTHEDIFKSHPKGKIGLQVHGIKKGTGPFEVRWKDIRIKELK